MEIKEVMIVLAYMIGKAFAGVCIGSLASYYAIRRIKHKVLKTRYIILAFFASWLIAIVISVSLNFENSWFSLIICILVYYVFMNNDKITIKY
jgi:hypothetical protein